VKRDNRKSKVQSLLKLINVSINSMALIYSTSATSISAADIEINKNGQLLMGIMNTMDQTLMKQQMSAQQMAQGAKAQQSYFAFKQNATKVLGSDQMNLNRHPIFKQCLTPPEQPGLRPIGLCTNQNLSNDFKTDTMRIAQDYINLYDKYLTKDNTGLQCLKNAMQDVKLQAQTLAGRFDDMLTNFETQMKKIDEQIKVQQAAIEDKHFLLNGGRQGGATQDLRNVNPREFFSPKCTEIMGQGKLVNAFDSGGLNKIRTILEARDEKAVGFRGNNLKNLKKQLEEDKRIFQSRIKENGMSGAASPSAFRGLKFAKFFQKAATEVSQDFNENFARAQSMLKDIGISIDAKKYNPMDPNFEKKIEGLVSQAQDGYKERYMMDCIKGRNRGSSSTSLPDIIKNFNHRVVDNGGTRLDDFKANAQSDIESASSVADLEARMRALDDQGIQATVINENNQKVSKTISRYFKDLKTECTTSYAGYAPDAKEVKDKLNKIKNDLNQVLAAKNGTKKQGTIEDTVDEILNKCDTSDVNVCSGDVYNTGADNFCFGVAETCSKQVSGCMAQAKEKIRVETEALKVAVNSYNSNVQTLQDAATNLTFQMKKAFEADANQLKATLFPSNLTPQMKAAMGIPEMSGLPSPELDTFGGEASLDNPFKLLMKPDMSLAEVMDSLRRNKESLKTNFLDHVGKQIDFTGEFIADQTKKWEEEKAAWEKMRDGCKGFMENQAKEIAGANIKAQEDYAKQMEKAKKFCADFNSYRKVPGCKNEGAMNLSDLYEDSSEVLGMMGDVRHAMDGYQGVCTEYNSEGTDDDSKEDITIENLCDQHGSGDSIIDHYSKTITDSLPPKAIKKKDEITTLIDNIKSGSITSRNEVKDKIKSIDESLVGTPTQNRILAMFTIANRGGIQLDTKVEIKNLFGDRNTDLINGKLSRYQDDKKDVCEVKDQFITAASITECVDGNADTEKACIQKNKKEDIAIEEAEKKFKKVIGAIKGMKSDGRTAMLREVGEQIGPTSCDAIAGGNPTTFGATGNFMQQMGQDSLGIQGMFR
jgi:hypothetical protein